MQTMTKTCVTNIEIEVKRENVHLNFTTKARFYDKINY